MAPRLLVAGVGNIFFGDDGFGVAAAGLLARRCLPPGVVAIDFGIRAYDLALALAGCPAAILIDAAPRGTAPGTLHVLEPLLPPSPHPDIVAAASGHGLTPDTILHGLPAAQRPAIVRVVGCEPQTLHAEPEDDLELPALSEPVRRALAPAVLLVERLIAEILSENRAVPHA